MLKVVPDAISRGWRRHLSFRLSLVRRKPTKKPLSCKWIPSRRGGDRLRLRRTNFSSYSEFPSINSLRSANFSLSAREFYHSTFSTATCRQVYQYNTLESRIVFAGVDFSHRGAKAVWLVLDSGPIRFLHDFRIGGIPHERRRHQKAKLKKNYK